MFPVIKMELSGKTVYGPMLKTTQLLIFASYKLNVRHISTSGLRDLLTYPVSQKKGATLTMPITLSVLDRFAKFFHCCKEQ